MASIPLTGLLRGVIARHDLQEFTLRRAAGGWQAIAVYSAAPSGPWGVGCDEDPITACEKALLAEVDFSRAEHGWQREDASAADEGDIFS